MLFLDHLPRFCLLAIFVVSVEVHRPPISLYTEGFQGMEHFEGVAYRHEEDMLCIENDECSKISPGLFCK